ncbi:MAG: cation transporter [Acidobacteria bacterium]|nr:cation transporter [Acidobacteriota bacterium]
MSGDSHRVAAVAGPEGTREGLRAIRISAVALVLTAVFQAVVVAISGSAALLADLLDNIGDIVTTVILAVAFTAARRAADHRYTFGYQRLEDLAGVGVVLVIWTSAGYAALESYRKLTGGHEVAFVGWAMAAALVGGIGNEVVARYKIRVGRRIGSEPLVADGQHARTDALASVAAFLGLLGARFGFRAADPIAGFVITLAIGSIAWGAGRQVLARLLDAVDPEIVERIRLVAGGTPSVASVGRCQARWAGRSLYVTLTVAVDGRLPLARAHEVAETVHHRILHELPGVAQVDVHLDPWEAHGDEAHASTRRHRGARGPS